MKLTPILLIALFASCSMSDNYTTNYYAGRLIELCDSNISFVEDVELDSAGLLQVESKYFECQDTLSFYLKKVSDFIYEEHKRVSIDSFVNASFRVTELLQDISELKYSFLIEKVKTVKLMAMGVPAQELDNYLKMPEEMIEEVFVQGANSETNIFYQELLLLLENEKKIKADRQKKILEWEKIIRDLKQAADKK